MFMFDTKDMSWWYWLASSACLWVTLSIHPDAYQWALLLGLVQLVHYRFIEGSIKRFPVQIRLAYVIYLLFAMPENLQWILWLPAIGSVARVVFGYCLLARLLALLPLNREVPLSWQYVLNTFFTRPVRGNILQGLPALKAA